MLVGGVQHYAFTHAGAHQGPHTLGDFGQVDWEPQIATVNLLRLLSNGTWRN